MFRLTTSRLMSSSPSAPLLVWPAHVHRLLQSNKPVSLLDATWFMPNSPRNAREEFARRRIPGAQFLDLDQVSSPHELGLKHMMPQERAFADACENFGIDPSSHVVIYDAHGIFSAPRALFMFRSFGHQRSSVMDGGLPCWVAEGYAVEQAAPVAVTKTHYPTPDLNAGSIKNYEQMVSNSAKNPSTDPTVELVLDARPGGRYHGTDPEPRPGLSSGHMPNSLSLPFNMFLQNRSAADASEYRTFLPAPELRKALVNAVGVTRANLVIDGKIPVVASCGSGMTAGVIWLGLKMLGVENISLYDESWTGYAMRESSKIEKS